MRCDFGNEFIPDDFPQMETVLFVIGSWFLKQDLNGKF